MIATGKENGKDRSTSVKKAFRDVYKDDYADGDEAERERIRDITSEYMIGEEPVVDSDTLYRWQLKYSGKNICKRLEGGNVDDAQNMIDEMYQVKLEHNLESAKTMKEKTQAKGKAASSLKSSISGVYKKMYQEGDASEKQRIIHLLNTIRAGGKKLFGQADYLKWNKENRG